MILLEICNTILVADYKIVNLYVQHMKEEAERSDLLIQMRKCIFKRKVAREASVLISWQWVSASGAAPRWRL